MQVLLFFNIFGFNCSLLYDVIGKQIELALESKLYPVR